ncbi:hypothetical protein [Variovorax sp. YR566]|jgi:hypothetical protein|uniref:hypothetical protein n=1 Tax=Variovorax sp. YR566 TaxID=3450237 RepID=UPI003F7CF403
MALPTRPTAEAILTKAAHGCRLEMGDAGGSFYSSAASASAKWPEASVDIEADGLFICLHADSDFSRQIFGRIVQFAAGEGVVTVQEL